MNKRINKVVIFAGGQGTRLGDVTKLTPKPLVPVGPDPVIVHIMRHFYQQGYDEFIIAVGYLSDEFKKYFRDYFWRGRNVTFTKYGYETENSGNAEDWKVHIVETGANATTAQRLHAVKSYIGDEPFFLTYGDSVGNVNLHEVEEAHFSNPNTLATLTLVEKTERFGIVEVNEHGVVTAFQEKSQSKAARVNGGYIACDNALLNEVNENTGDFSFEVLARLGAEGKLGAYEHNGFWSAMDTKQDNDRLNSLYETNPELFGL